MNNIPKLPSGLKNLLFNDGTEDDASRLRSETMGINPALDKQYIYEASPAHSSTLISKIKSEIQNQNLVFTTEFTLTEQEIENYANDIDDHRRYYQGIDGFKEYATYVKTQDTRGNGIDKEVIYTLKIIQIYDKNVVYDPESGLLTDDTRPDMIDDIKSSKGEDYLLQNYYTDQHGKDKRIYELYHDNYINEFIAREAADEIDLLISPRIVDNILVTFNHVLDETRAKDNAIFSAFVNTAEEEMNKYIISENRISSVSSTDMYEAVRGEFIIYPQINKVVILEDIKGFSRHNTIGRETVYPDDQTSPLIDYLSLFRSGLQIDASKRVRLDTSFMTQTGNTSVSNIIKNKIQNWNNSNNPVGSARADTDVKVINFKTDILLKNSTFGVNKGNLKHMIQVFESATQDSIQGYNRYLIFYVVPVDSSSGSWQLSFGLGTMNAVPSANLLNNFGYVDQDTVGDSMTDYIKSLKEPDKTKSAFLKKALN
tara:strand:+ start:5483 stop:6934 length:1452 start_codon:yes stop_codon:yes gene_type:complete